MQTAGCGVQPRFPDTDHAANHPAADVQQPPRDLYGARARARGTVWKICRVTVAGVRRSVTGFDRKPEAITTTPLSKTTTTTAYGLVNLIFNLPYWPAEPSPTTKNVLVPSVVKVRRSPPFPMAEFAQPTGIGLLQVPDQTDSIVSKLLPSETTVNCRPAVPTAGRIFQTASRPPVPHAGTGKLVV